jgi:hypothetical protein
MKFIDRFACPQMVIACTMIAFFMLVSVAIAVKAAPAPMPMSEAQELAVLKAYMQQMLDSGVRDRTTRNEARLDALDRRMVESQTDLRAAISQTNTLVMGLLASVLTLIVGGFFGGRVVYRKVNAMPQAIQDTTTCPLSKIDRDLMHRSYGTFVKAMEVEEERLRLGRRE